MLLEHTGYKRGCQCDRCEAARERGRKNYRERPDTVRPGRREYKTAKQREYDQARRVEQIAAGVKHCTGCDTTRTLDQFPTDVSRPLGVKSRCKDCCKASYDRRREYKQQHRVMPSPDERRAYYQGLRSQAVTIYGGTCAQCEATENLQFDHVNDDGAEHRRSENSMTMLARIVAIGRLPDWDLQLLCRPCHLTKTTAKGVPWYRLVALMAAGNDWPAAV